MVGRNDLTKYGFIQEPRDNRPELCDGIEI